MKGFLKSKLVLSLIALVLMAGVIAIPLSGSITRSHAAAPSGMVTLTGSVPKAQIAHAHLLGHHSVKGEQLTVALVLAMNNQDQMNALMKALYDQHSSQFHHWLATGEFDARFGPTPSQVSAAKSFLTGAGLTLVSENTSAFIVEAQGSLNQIEAAFHVSIKDYRSSDGKVFFSNDTDPQIPASLKGIIVSVLGLNDVPVPLPNHRSSSNPTPFYGGGPGGSGLTPSQLAGIYNADPVYTKFHDEGQGVTLGLFELGDYTHKDIGVYEKQFGLPKVPISIIKTGVGPIDHSVAGEVELDIEAQIALAPKVKRILVYEASDLNILGTGLPELLNFPLEEFKIAFDNKADIVSISYGVCEPDMPTAFTLAESVAFAQMALQGQSAFASSGDTGAFGCERFNPSDHSLQVLDPASQPFVTGVGGTSFTTFDPGQNPHPKYPGTKAEQAWSGSGGGVSQNWARPIYQVGPGVDEPGFSQSGLYCGQLPLVPCREVPDVSLVADPNSGFAQYCTDSVDCLNAKGKPLGWFADGGTSLSSPLWSAIAALMNNHNGGRLGLYNFFLYEDNSADGHTEEVHDITIGNNGFYPAGPFYDMVTGIGTTDIFNMLNEPLP